MATWRMTCGGIFDEEAMAATVIELGGFWRGGWFITSDRHPAYLCRRLAANFLGGPYNVRLDVATSR